MKRGFRIWLGFKWIIIVGLLIGSYRLGLLEKKHLEAFTRFYKDCLNSLEGEEWLML